LDFAGRNIYRAYKPSKISNYEWHRRDDVRICIKSAAANIISTPKHISIECVCEQISSWLTSRKCHIVEKHNNAVINLTCIDNRMAHGELSVWVMNPAISKFNLHPYLQIAMISKIKIQYDVCLWPIAAS